MRHGTAQARTAWALVLVTALSLAPVEVRAVPPTREEAPPAADLAPLIRGLDDRVFAEDERRSLGLAGMVARGIRSGVRAANLRESEAWAGVKTRADWEGFRDARLRALRE